MLFKKVILTVAAIFILLIFFNTDFYGTWFSSKVWSEKEQLDDQLEHMSIQERREMRWGKPYMAAEEMQKVLSESKTTAPPLILLPPNDYMKAINFDFLVPEPAVLYYYNGLHSVWTNSPDARKANWALVVIKGNMRFVPIEDSVQLNYWFNLYKDYKAEL